MREKELRLALICYGGVSLAIYMHGVTREIWHLIRASRAYHDGTEAAAGSEAVYRDLIARIEEVAGTRLRIFTDIVAGSSAGGINGVFLSQAVVTGQSLEPLTDLWLEKADVEVLLDPDARPLSRFSKFWAIPIAWMILRRRGGAIDRMVSDEAKEEVAAKLSRFVRARWFAPPFGGRVFSGLLFDALDAMAKGAVGKALLPPHQPLDLFVTVTDFAGHDQILMLNSPSMVVESEHRITIDFSTRGKSGDNLAAIPELVFAARATASFPGAFPPFSARELDAQVKARKLEWPSRDVFLQRILPQQFAVGAAADTMLIDGSVLANAPFNQAIEALRNRPARREVDRRFVYIDPKPGRPSFRFGKRGSSNDKDSARMKPPGFFSTIFGATSNIPREQPIRDSLEKLEGRTERIERMRQITDNLRVEVEKSIEKMLGKTWFLSQPTPERLQKWRSTANEKAANAAGYSYPAYGHLKLSGVVDDIMAIARRAWPEGQSNHFRQLRGAIWTEIRERGLDAMVGNKGVGATRQSIQFFREHDIRFRIRRLRFLARRLAHEIEADYGEGGIGTKAMHDNIYACLSLFLERETSDYLGANFAKLVENGIDHPGDLLDALAQRRGLIETDRLTDRILCDALLLMPDDNRRIMLLGYIGYPLYDIATLPLLQGEGLDEFDPVKVDRISPEDCHAIRSGGAAATLKGIEFNNFGAFFSRAYRENDYLWGRLHGAERLIDIVLSSLPAAMQISDADIRTSKRAAFAAILDQEQERLNRIRPLTTSLRSEIEALGGTAP
ncbi:MAG: patatin-like protein [Sphingomonadaceae bacterium]|nr:patatin-like protein [Sphingomonadaceae bacterium]